MGFSYENHGRFIRVARNNPMIYRQLFGFHRIVCDYVINGIHSIVEWNLHRRPSPEETQTEYGSVATDHETEEPSPITSVEDHRLRRHSAYPYGNPRFVWQDMYEIALAETEQPTLGPRPKAASREATPTGKAGTKGSGR